MMHKIDLKEKAMGIYRFGYWESQKEFSCDEFIICHLPPPQYSKSIAESSNIAQRGNNWFFPQIYTDNQLLVKCQQGRFVLPVTHTLTMPNRVFDKDFGEFLVLVLGFLYGLRLTLEGNGHLLKTPWRECTLVNFCSLKSNEMLHCLQKALVFWDSSTEEQRKLLFSSIHWYLVGQSYVHQHEIFSNQYMVLDNIHALTEKIPQNKNKYGSNFRNNNGNISHGKRASALGEYYGTPLPDSFKVNGDGAAVYISQLRNQLVHEARWLDEPIGYAVNSNAHEVTMELTAFNSQIILGILGIECKFRKEKAPAWQIYCLEISL